MRDGNHLRKVDDGRLVFVADENVEFVKVAVNQAVVTEFHNQRHQFAVKFTWIRQVMHLTPKNIKKKLIHHQKREMEISDKYSINQSIN